ncbi:MAG: hypothetical protein Q4G67_01660 [Actinomycetia bacterium]|nr:hypothetical protein [Actinomycetes bacterium]
MGAGQLWHSGSRVDGSALDVETTWARVSPLFLGCGYAVTVPAVRDRASAIGYARARAAEVAEALGATIDSDAWDEIASTDGALRVQGGWEFQPGRPFSAAWTRITEIPPAEGRRVVEVAASELPWPANATGATAGLAVLPTADDELALRQVLAAGADVGMWFTGAGLLSGTTRGPLVLRTADGRWITPAPATGWAPTWMWTEVSQHLDAREIGSGEDVLDAPLVCVVTDVGDLLPITSVDGRPCPMEQDALRQVAAARDSLLADGSRSPSD